MQTLLESIPTNGATTADLYSKCDWFESQEHLLKELKALQAAGAVIKEGKTWKSVYPFGEDSISVKKPEDSRTTGKPLNKAAADKALKALKTRLSQQVIDKELKLDVLDQLSRLLDPGISQVLDAIADDLQGAA
ncbi:hypothetical protein HCH_02856 [Hahella chejuensis KCTC 2396]|uniref:Uncharacterized protein n=1 Tax=Hahella chejuensis (strain KCTC 2396) TaxID=349521 RepID=Q2SI90_HAHCH|nr:hypothetical protein [Hahella chejuensis]ABC29634.1 hypothetical protein HCH_02856 [Hahella chejuensis KCTC 2396]